MSKPITTTIPTDNSIDMSDPDNAELAAALAEANAEGGVADPGDGGEEVIEIPQEPATDPVPAPAPAPTPASEEELPADEDEDPEPAPSATVPHKAFAKVKAQKRELEEDNAYLRGRLEALQTTHAVPASPPPPPEPPKPTIKEQINELRAKKTEAARKYDAGDSEMSAERLEAIRDEIDDQIADLRAQELREAVKPATAPQGKDVGWADRQLLEQQAAELHQQHQYLDHMNKAQMQELTSLARREALLQGKPYGNTVADTARLREHVAELSDMYGPRWHPNVKVRAAAPASAPVSPPPAPAKPAMSPTATARARKLELAESLPPNTAAMGGHGAPAAEISEAQIDKMSDDEIAALPPATLKRLLEG